MNSNKIKVNQGKETVDWTNSDEEPIDMPGSIQPHGVLFVLQEPELKILQVSNNTSNFFGLLPENLLNKNLEMLLDKTQVDGIKAYLDYENLQRVNPFKVEVKTAEKERSRFDGIIHRVQPGLILELEASKNQKNQSFFDFYHPLKLSLTKLHNAKSFMEVCQIAVKEVRQITGVERVMLYKFDRAGDGMVIAEDKLESLSPCLGLHYPATDIPQAARKLFAQNRLRSIADLNYQPVKIIPEHNPLTNKPVDLSLAVLRSASPCHVEYLKNMGVGYSLTISLFNDNKLWGLIACHHKEAKYIPYEVRAACEMLGQSLCSEIAGKEYNEDYEYQIELKSIEAKLLSAMSEEENFVNGLVKEQRNLLYLVSAQGAAVCLGSEIAMVGKTPERKQIEELVTWLDNIFHKNVFYTDGLPVIYQEAEKYKDVASGLLAIYIAKEQKKYILWFRSEVIQTVNWAGDPNEGKEIGEDGSVVRSPRTSFELWKENVRCKSLPWKQCEIEAAVELKQAIISIVLRKADELAALNAALQKSEAREREKAMQLEQTLAELTQAQTQLVQSEKMSSLGQLVAGVAHEINNPVNFIYGNITHADGYSQDLLKLVNLYEQYYPEPVPEIQEQMEAIEFDFLIEDLPKLLGSMKLGAERIREIIKSLRNFSRLDEAQMKSVDIHEGIDSTLLILGNRLKVRSDRPGIQVIKEYGNLPKVECYAGQLNQVFMNLLANAIDALEEYNQNRSLTEKMANPSQITIRTELSKAKSQMSKVIIGVADNGPGIPEAVQSKLFDPFFTTKPAGKGTGIGLAISYQIVVEKHGGQLKCVSTLGKGTEFIVEIPLKRK